MDIKEKEHTVSIDGKRIYTKIWEPQVSGIKHRPPILLLHSSLGCVGLWRDFPYQLALTTRRCIIAYDRLGFGQSDPYPGKIGFDFIEAEARRFIPQIFDDLGVTDFIACGHSVGGGMAVEAAASLQSRCKALITIAAQAFVEDRTLEGIRISQRHFQDDATFSRLYKYHGDKARRALDAWINTWLAPEFAQWNLDAALENVRCPVFAIHGEKDEYGTSAHPKRIAAGRGSHFIVPGAMHAPHNEQEDVVLDTIKEFLAALP